MPMVRGGASHPFPGVHPPRDRFPAHPPDATPSPNRRTNQNIPTKKRIRDRGSRRAEGPEQGKNGPNRFRDGPKWPKSCPKRVRIEAPEIGIN